MYALGLGAVESGNLDFINRIFRRTVVDHSSGIQTAASILVTLVDSLAALGYLKGCIEGRENYPLPVYVWLYETMRQPLKPLIPDDDEYMFIFDKFEILAALTYVSIKHGNSSSVRWFPLGSYIWRATSGQRALNEIEQSIQNDKQSPYISSRIFGDTQSDCLQIIEQFKALVPNTAMRLGFYNNNW